MDQVQVLWKINQIIRHIETGHPYLVTHNSRYFVTLVDLESTEPLSPTLTLLPRNYHKYASDKDLEIKKKGENEEWEYNRITL